MRQILFTNEKGTFDLATRQGKEAAFGKTQCMPVVMANEQGEVICAYNNVGDIPKNTQLVKSLRQKYPGQPLLKALDMFENELLLKAKREKIEMMLKSKQIKPPKPKKTATSYWGLLLEKLEAMG